MKTHSFTIVIAVSLFLFFSSVATQAQSYFADEGSGAAESGISSKTSPHGYRELSIYTSGTLANPQFMSDLKHQRLFFTGVRLTSRLFTTQHLCIGGNLDVKPLIIHSGSVPTGREYTYGGGTSVGLQFSSRKQWRYQPFFDVDGGFVCFTHNTPLPNTRRLNMSLDFGPGVTIPLRGNDAIRTGVWVFHFSDGNTVGHNPAFDGIMAYVSYTYRNFVPPLHHRRPS
jgi:hypothetical protein